MNSSGQAASTEQHLRGLLLQGLAGDSRAYQAFLQALSSYLRAFLRRRLAGLPDEVEDLLQECQLALHNQRHTYDCAQPLTAWVHAIAKYKLIDLLRRRALREQLHEPLDDELNIFSTADLDAAEARHDVEFFLAQLPPHQRLPIMHMKLQGLSVAEAAVATGMSESAIKVGVHRGLKALARLLGANA